MNNIETTSYSYSCKGLIISKDKVEGGKCELRNKGQTLTVFCY